MVLRIEEQRLDDAEDAARRIVRPALDLEARPRTEALPGEVGVVRHLVRQEPAVGRAIGDLPGIEAYLDDQMSRAQRDAVRGGVDRPRPGVGAADHVAELLGGAERPGRHPHADHAGRDGAQRHARRGQTLRDALELDPIGRSLPGERACDAEIAGFHGYPLTAPSVSPFTR